MKRYSVFLIIIVFFMLYHPPLFTINSLHLIGAFSWIYIFFNWKFIKNNLNLKKVFYIYVVLIYVMAYLFLIAHVNGNSYYIVTTYLFWIVDILPACITICTICIKKKYNLLNLLTLLLIVGNIQGLLALLTLIFPSFQLYFVERMVSYGYQERLLYLSSYRMFGIASYLTFTTPIIQSMFSMIAIYFSIRVNIKYIFFIPLLLFSALINARTSIVIIMLGFLVYLIILTIDKKRLFKSISIIYIFLISLFGVISIIRANSPETYKWISDGFSEILHFLKGENVGYFSYVTDKDKYILPNDLGLLFGKGTRPIGDFFYTTDVGWINDIWVGGFLYIIIIYSLFAFILYEINAFKDKNISLRKFIAIFFGGTMVLVNFKGAVFLENEVTSVIFLIYIFLMYRVKQRDIINS